MLIAIETERETEAPGAVPPATRRRRPHGHRKSGRGARSDLGRLLVYGIRSVDSLESDCCGLAMRTGPVVWTGRVISPPWF